MRKLTIEEEIKVLETLSQDTFMASGSARCTYFCLPKLADFLGLSNKNAYVIKLGCGTGGFTQNKQEIEMYRDYQAKDHLAEIVAYGFFVEIMEAVGVRDCSDCGCLYDGVLSREKLVDDLMKLFSEEDAYAAADTILFLTDILGTSADNGQLGITEDNRIVSFDYGFRPDDGFAGQCSNYLTGIVEENSEGCKDYCGRLIKTLQDMSKCQDLTLFHRIVKTIEYDILMNYQY